MVVRFSKGEPPLFQANHEYRVIAWGTRDGEDFIFFEANKTIFSSPAANAENFRDSDFARLKAIYPEWPMRPLPPCCR